MRGYSYINGRPAYHKRVEAETIAAAYGVKVLPGIPSLYVWKLMSLLGYRWNKTTQEWQKRYEPLIEWRN